MLYKLFIIKYVLCAKLAFLTRSHESTIPKPKSEALFVNPHLNEHHYITDHFSLFKTQQLYDYKRQLMLRFKRKQTTADNIDLLKMIDHPDGQEKALNTILKSLHKHRHLASQTYFFERTIFHYLVMRKKVIIASGLMSSEFFPMVFLTDRTNQSVVHYAVQTKHYDEEMLQLLIKTIPALVDSPDKKGQTPLIKAVLDKNTNAAKSLVTLGNANIYRKDNSQKSAYDYALDDPTMRATIVTPIHLDNTAFQTAFHSAFSTSTMQKQSPEALAELTERFSNLRLTASSSHESKSSSEQSPHSAPSHLTQGHDTSYTDSGNMLHSNSTEIDTSSASQGTSKTFTTANDSTTQYSAPYRTHDLLSSTSALDILTADSSEALSCDDDVSDNQSGFTTLGLAELRSANLRRLSEFLIDGGDPNVKVIANRRVIHQAFIYATLPPDSSFCETLTEPHQVRLRSRLAEQFYLLLMCSPLEDTGEEDVFFKLSNQRPHSLEILTEAENRLNIAFNAKTIELRFQLQSASEKIDQFLFRAGLGKSTPDPITEKTDHYYAEWAIELNESNKVLKANASYIQIINLLCENHDTAKDDRVFNKNDITYSALGLQNYLPASEIVLYLVGMLPRFDLYQKLTAILLVKELLMTDVHHQLANDLLFCRAIEAFTCAIQSDSSLPPSAGEQSALLNEIYELKLNYTADLIIINKHVLQKCQRYHVDCHQAMSIDTLLKSALTSETKERQNCVIKFAQDLNSLSIMFFQDVHLDEFHNKAWERENKNATSPNIVEHLNLYNRVVNLITDSILRMPAEEIPYAIAFCVEVAQMLCEGNDPIGPDLNAAMKILGALDIGPISRMASVLERVPQHQQQLLGELLELTNPAHNYSWQRKLIAQMPHTLPFCGILTKDIINILENTNLLAKIKLLGKNFSEIIRAQVSVSGRQIRLNTNIVYAANYYADLDADTVTDRQYEMSYRVVPLASEQPADFDAISSLDALFKMLDNMISAQNIPHKIKHQGRINIQGDIIPVTCDVYHSLAKLENKHLDNTLRQFCLTLSQKLFSSPNLKSRAIDSKLPTLEHFEKLTNINDLLDAMKQINNLAVLPATITHQSKTFPIANIFEISTQLFMHHNTHPGDWRKSKNLQLFCEIFQSLEAKLLKKGKGKAETNYDLSKVESLKDLFDTLKNGLSEEKAVFSVTFKKQVFSSACLFPISMYLFAQLKEKHRIQSRQTIQAYISQLENILSTQYHKTVNPLMVCLRLHKQSLPKGYLQKPEATTESTRQLSKKEGSKRYRFKGK